MIRQRSRRNVLIFSEETIQIFLIAPSLPPLYLRLYLSEKANLFREYIHILL